MLDTYAAATKPLARLETSTVSVYVSLLRLVSQGVIGFLDKWTEPKAPGNPVLNSHPQLGNEFNRVRGVLDSLAAPDHRLDAGALTTLHGLEMYAAKLAALKRTCLASGSTAAIGVLDIAHKAMPRHQWKIATEAPIGWVATPVNAIDSPRYTDPGVYKPPLILVEGAVRDFGAARYAVYRTVFRALNAPNLESVYDTCLKQMPVKPTVLHPAFTLLNALHGDLVAAALTIWKEPKRNPSYLSRPIREKIDDLAGHVLAKDPLNPGATILAIVTKRLCDQVLSSAAVIATKSRERYSPCKPITLLVVVPPSFWPEIGEQVSAGTL